MLRLILIDIRNYLRLCRFKKEWRKINKHNLTEAANIFPVKNVEVGYRTYGELKVRVYHECDYKLKIGSFCSIASNVVFLLCAEHDMSRTTTYPIETFVLHKEETGKKSKGDIIVEDDVWFCENVTVLSGVHIGKGAVISAGSIVVNDIPPYAIYGNYRILGYRFNNEKIRELVSFDLERANPDELMKIQL